MKTLLDAMYVHSRIKTLYGVYLHVCSQIKEVKELLKNIFIFNHV